MNTNFKIEDDIAARLAKCVYPEMALPGRPDVNEDNRRKMTVRLKAELTSFLIVQSAKMEDERLSVPEQVARIKKARDAYARLVDAKPEPVASLSVEDMSEAAFRRMVLQRFEVLRDTVNKFGKRIKCLEDDAIGAGPTVRRFADHDSFWNTAFEFMKDWTK